MLNAIISSNSRKSLEWAIRSSLCQIAPCRRAHTSRCFLRHHHRRNKQTRTVRPMHVNRMREPVALKEGRRNHRKTPPSSRSAHTRTALRFRTWTPPRHHANHRLSLGTHKHSPGHCLSSSAPMATCSCARLPKVNILLRPDSPLSCCPSALRRVREHGVAGHSLRCSGDGRHLCSPQ